MSCYMFKYCVIAISVLVACSTKQINAAVSSAFENACHNGADARVEFHVVDDIDKPVPNAKVNVFFDMMDRSKGRRIIGDADTNGVFVAEARTGGVLEIEVSREGYYLTKDEICFITMGHEHEVKNGKWQPWGIQEKVILRPIRNPVAVRVCLNQWLRTKVLNKWIGFDLERGDFVAPVGNGTVNDVEIKFDWDGMFGTKHNGMAVSLRFPDRFSGGYYVDRSTKSGFTGIYAADPDTIYTQDFYYHRHPIRDSKGRIISVEGNGFDQSKALVVRSRCVVDENGQLVSAQYFLIENLDFACDREKRAALIFDLIYNPTPNDTNLEPK